MIQVKQSKEDDSQQREQQNFIKSPQQDIKENQFSSRVFSQPQQRFGHRPSIIYRSEIDGLRCLAILPVICFHFQLLQDYTSGGFGGVDVFFVISGFLVNSIIISDLLKGKFSLLTFYERRVRRLFPAIFTVLAVVLVTGYALYFEKEGYQELVREETAALGNFANVYFYARRDQMGDGYFDDNTQQWPFLHFWSLAVEEQFYMLTPLALMLVMNCSQKGTFLGRMLVYSIITIAVSLGLSIWLTEQNQMFAFYLLPCRAWELGLGGLIAILLHEETVRKIQRALQKYSLFQKSRVVTCILQIASWVGLIMVLYSYAAYNKKEDHFPGYKALLPCCGVGLFIAANFVRYDDTPIHTRISSQQSQALAPKRIMLSSARLMSLPPVVLIGEISYSLYLWHWPIWVLVNYTIVDGEMTFMNKIFSFFAAILIAYFSTRQIEKPFRNSKTISKSILWKIFGVTWIIFLSILFYNMEMNTGGVTIMERSNLNVTKSFNSLGYPKYDSQGDLIHNPYRSLLAQEISFQKMKKPLSASHFKGGGMKSPYFHSATRGPFKDLKPILINYSEQDKKHKKQICIATLGSSHTQQHHQTITDLAIKYNVSLVLLACSDTKMSFFTKNSKQWDQWRLKQLSIFKPRIIFAQNDWKVAIQGFSNAYQKAIDPLLSLENPPDYIGIFGDAPYAGLSDPISKNINHKFIETGNSFKFMEKLNETTINRQVQTQAQVERLISLKYQNSPVHYYPYLHQFLQDHQTGNIQIVGSEVDGKLLYYDRKHLTLDGSMRFMRYFEQKIFKKAKQICK